MYLNGKMLLQLINQWFIVFCGISCWISCRPNINNIWY